MLLPSLPGSDSPARPYYCNLPKTYLPCLIFRVPVTSPLIPGRESRPVRTQRNSISQNQNQSGRSTGIHQIPFPIFEHDTDRVQRTGRHNTTCRPTCSSCRLKICPDTDEGNRAFLPPKLHCCAPADHLRLKFLVPSFYLPTSGFLPEFLCSSKNRLFRIFAFYSPCVKR